MTLREYLKGRSKFDEAAQRLVDEMTGFEERLVRRIIDRLGELELYNGEVVPSEDNLVRISQIIDQIERDFPDPEWIDAVSDYIRSYDFATDDAIAYFSTLQPNLNRDLIEVLKVQFQGIMAEFLLSGETFRKTLFLPIRNQNAIIVSSGGNLVDLIDNARTISDDSLIIEGAQGPVKAQPTMYERSATLKAADDIGAEFFLYQGRNIKTTRPFCKDRAGRYWHRKEIEEWGESAKDNPWSGMVDGTNAENIWIYLGGWYGDERSCRHVLVPVSIDAVPQEDISRMRSKGLI